MFDAHAFLTKAAWTRPAPTADACRAARMSMLPLGGVDALMVLKAFNERMALARWLREHLMCEDVE